MAIRTYGELRYTGRRWTVIAAEPHVRIKLKAIFGSINKTANPPYVFENHPQTAADLLWFISRYPLTVSEEDLFLLRQGDQLNTDRINALEEIILPTHSIDPTSLKLKNGYEARQYQLKAHAIFGKVKKMLLADEYGVGKTLTSILGLLDSSRLPAAVVVETHMPWQWENDGIGKFTNLVVHRIKKTKPYDLPPADVYLFTYSKMFGWIDFFHTKFFKYAIFDECQSLRREGSARYNACAELARQCEWVMGLSATPIYNYGSEIYNVLDGLNEECLGKADSFSREWSGEYRRDKFLIADPAALGTYLRENFLMLRRTREELGIELPQVNTIVEWVDADEDLVAEDRKMAQMLAINVLTGSFTESGQAARELDIKLRRMTGIAKAHAVAGVVKILLESGERVLLAGWHRDVYEMWNALLFDYNPVMYTGSENPAQKNESFKRFTSGDSQVMFISLRSGAGLEGLQYHCSYCVVGELDYSPQVHGQLVSRLDRPGAPRPVTAIYPVCNFGSDPAILDILGLKSSQSHYIVDPLKTIKDQHTDKSLFKEMARKYLISEGITPPEPNKKAFPICSWCQKEIYPGEPTSTSYDRETMHFGCACEADDPEPHIPES